MIARTTSQKVGDWKGAYDAIREELTPAPLRVILATMTEVEGVAQLASYMQLASAVMANDRAAGTIAAMLTANGIKPVATLEYGED